LIVVDSLVVMEFVAKGVEVHVGEGFIASVEVHVIVVGDAADVHHEWRWGK
jgi:hypothetical protein